MAKTYRSPMVASLGNAAALTHGNLINKPVHEPVKTTTTASLLDL